MPGSQQQTSTNQTQAQNTGPWAPQQGYLLDAFNRSQNALNANTAQGAYSGDYLAAGNPQQYNVNNGAYNWATGTGANTVNGILNTGNANNAAGWGGANGALGGMANFANTDQTQNNINSAGQYADNPYISGAVDSAMRDATRTASETTIPNLYRTDAASGNLNSDRSALAQGVVERGLGEQAGALSAAMRNTDYNNGLSLAEQSNAQRLQALSQQGALGSNIGQSGLNAQSTAINDNAALSNQALAGANNLQALDQQRLNNEIQRYQTQQNFPWQQLANYYNIVGGRSWGTNGVTSTQGTSTTQNTPSVMSDIGAGLGIAGSAMGSGGIMGPIMSGFNSFSGGMTPAAGDLGQGSGLYNMALANPSMIQGMI